MVQRSPKRDKSPKNAGAAYADATEQLPKSKLVYSKSRPLAEERKKYKLPLKTDDVQIIEDLSVEFDVREKMKQ